jgi:transcriptional regulator with GAF, ATPase, and Fis domain
MSEGDDPTTLSDHRPRGRLRTRGRVLVLAGPAAGEQLEFEGRVRIGSRALADFVIADPKVSGLHCEVVTGDDLRVRDLGSKNGTFVGPLRVVEAVISPGEAFSIGDSRVRVMPLEGLIEPLDSGTLSFHGLVGTSPAMRSLITRIEAIAQSASTVLICGETGTGKDHVAEAIHLASPRASGPLITVDCGAIQPLLVESELFGHERGAFTGAEQRFIGAFERAAGGTILLDEVGELPRALQPKLLRALEAREIRRLGGTRMLPLDVRVIAATNRDLALEVATGRFREDLYYRLAVVQLTVPPLRDRIADLPLLIRELVERIGGDATPFLTLESLETMSAHHWPGNVRELRNAIERAVGLAEPLRVGPTVPPRDLTVAIDLGVPLLQLRQQAMAELERRYLLALLDECNGKVAEVARRSGLERMTIYRMMRRHRLR